MIAVLKRQEALICVRVEAPMSDEVEDVPLALEQPLLELAPGPADQPGQVDELAIDQRPQGRLESLLNFQTMVSDLTLVTADERLMSVKGARILANR